MSVAFDATFLLPLLHPNVRGPLDPATNQPLDFLRERLDYLVESLENDRAKIIIPTPALSELLVRAGNAGPAYLDRFRQSRSFKVEPFDERAAVEVAVAIRHNIDQMGRKRGTAATETWAKVKFDQQIIAIAKVNGATILYSDDEGLRDFAAQAHLTVVRLRELALPPKEAQMPLDLQTKPKPIPE
ncbi:type II toxin-antitoxin system VapC family toxin [Candidatus Binatus sp.]|uniref:type II toxin-antitoxin system VapC family toxin n=1 Tax=Candidatus Binatus sp. TaxID=2811406 RepID=UPI003BBF9635